MTDTDQQDHKLILRGLKRPDYPRIKEIMDRVYAGMGGAWKPEEFSTLLERFPEGQICIEDNGTVV
ncbi:MAG: hydrolase, partial [Desulfobacterales bacterium]